MGPELAFRESKPTLSAVTPTPGLALLRLWFLDGRKMARWSEFSRRFRSHPFALLGSGHIGPFG